VIGETDKMINQKVKTVLGAGMDCVLCVGETLEQRESGQANQVNERQVRAALTQVPEDQMERLIVAYEPVWAIGTGRNASPEDAQDAHAKIRYVLEDLYGPRVAHQTRIIYGGSVKPANARAIFDQPDVDGGLIGGASLKVGDFVSIAKSAAESAQAGD
jgi:triosephosphate isomerase